MQDYGADADTTDIAFLEDDFEDLDHEHGHANENISHQFRNLTEAERKAIYEALVKRSMRGRLKRNTTIRVAEMLQVSRYQSATYLAKSERVSCTRKTRGC